MCCIVDGKLIASTGIDEMLHSQWYKGTLCDQSIQKPLNPFQILLMYSVENSILKRPAITVSGYVNNDEPSL